MMQGNNKVMDSSERSLYFDAFNGVSGDMVLGALIDLGLPIEHLSEELASLDLEGYRLVANEVERQGIRGINFQVQTSSDHSHRGFSKIENLIQHLAKLPGLGPRSARRAALHLIKRREALLEPLASSMQQAADAIRVCSRCGTVDTSDPCAICIDPKRDASIICVVEDPLDVLALERTRSFRGLYHVLHGVISPINGVGPDQIKLKELFDRLGTSEVTELVIATNPTLEGEATAMYLRLILGPLGLRVTRLARGLPSGGELEYADEMTLLRAFEGRQEFD